MGWMVVQGAKQGSDWFGEVDVEELVGKELFQTLYILADSKASDYSE